MMRTSIAITKSRNDFYCWAYLSPWLCVLLIGSLGCGDARPKTYPVSGTIRFADGSKVRSGYVELVPTAGGPSARATISQQGAFVVGTYTNDDGAVPGEFKVLILQHGRQIGPEEARELGDEHAGHEGSDRFVSLKYSSREMSDLVCTVSDTEENRLSLVVDSRKLIEGRLPKHER